MNVKNKASVAFRRMLQTLSPKRDNMISSRYGWPSMRFESFFLNRQSKESSGWQLDLSRMASDPNKRFWAFIGVFGSAYCYVLYRAKSS